MIGASTRKVFLKALTSYKNVNGLVKVRLYIPSMYDLLKCASSLQRAVIKGDIPDKFGYRNYETNKSLDLTLSRLIQERANNARGSFCASVSTHELGSHCPATHFGFVRSRICSGRKRISISSRNGC